MSQLFSAVQPSTSPRVRTDRPVCGPHARMKHRGSFSTQPRGTTVSLSCFPSAEVPGDRLWISEGELPHLRAHSWVPCDFVAVVKGQGFSQRTLTSLLPGVKARSQSPRRSCTRHWCGRSLALTLHGLSGTCLWKQTHSLQRLLSFPYQLYY